MSSRAGQSKDSANTLANNDSIANALAIIDEIHRRIHKSEYYTFSFVTTVLTSSSAGVRMSHVTGDPFHMSFRATAGTTQDVILRFYEDATFDTEGTDVAPVNHNRVGGGTSKVLFNTSSLFSAGTIIFEMVLPPFTPFESVEWIPSQIAAPAGDLYLEFTNPSAVQAVNCSLNIDVYDAESESI